MERAWNIGCGNHFTWPKTEVFPERSGPFIRATVAGSHRQLVLGQWGLIPWFAKSPKLTYSTCNARSEEMNNKASFKPSWARGRRCIIPAESFDEPNWEAGRNVWWRFRRADTQPWALAGLWNTWIDKETGEMVESYTMLTINADAHPLMRRMHKPDPNLPPDQQDKRSVIPIEVDDVDQWLMGSTADAHELLKLAPAEVFDAGPAQ
jgi:putative SOS response-associated peptidase YedK